MQQPIRKQVSRSVINFFSPAALPPDEADRQAAVDRSRIVKRSLSQGQRDTLRLSPRSRSSIRIGSGLPPELGLRHRKHREPFPSARTPSFIQANRSSSRTRVWTSASRTILS